METLAPYLPAVFNAYCMNFILAYLLGIHLVCNNASLNLFISYFYNFKDFYYKKTLSNKDIGIIVLKSNIYL